MEISQSPAAAKRHVGPASVLNWVRRQPRRISASLRTRIVAWLIGLLVFATVSSVLVTRTVLLERLDQRIHANLVQESRELQRLATGNDPETGEPFGTRASRIFAVYLQRNVPSQNETFLTFVEGRPFLRTPRAVPYRLDRDPEIVARWGGLTTTARGHTDTPAGRVEYLAVPLQDAGETVGVFVAAVFRDREREDVDEAVRAAGAVGLAILLIGSLLAWRLAENMIGPVTALTRTARSISGTELSSRIPVRGNDEVAQLAATFNDMLGRLERAFASQREFLDDAGHELKTPLTIVRGHLELLDDDPVERQETLALVMDELERMGRIIQDLLLLARHERPDFLDVAAVDVGGLTDEVYAKAKGLAAREWVLEQQGAGTIVADRQRLTQAMLQLAQNAARYSPPGEPIGLGSAVVGGEARFWIRDRGRGIPADEQTRVFERFDRGAGERPADGVGLGLTIVKAIAEAHKGRVELESRPSAGSLFTVVIPADQDEHEATAGWPGS
jgi:two-component system OmpR family sensor kinase